MYCSLAVILVNSSASVPKIHVSHDSLAENIVPDNGKCLCLYPSAAFDVWEQLNHLQGKTFQLSKPNRHATAKYSAGSSPHQRTSSKRKGCRSTYMIIDRR